LPQRRSTQTQPHLKLGYNDHDNMQLPMNGERHISEKNTRFSRSFISSVQNQMLNESAINKKVLVSPALR
jgi:hypothetical protein